MTDAPKRKPGRPPAAPGAGQTAMIRERVTPAQRDRYRAMGGKAWLVAALNQSKSGTDCTAPG